MDGAILNITISNWDGLVGLSLVLDVGLVVGGAALKLTIFSRVGFVGLTLVGC